MTFNVTPIAYAIISLMMAIITTFIIPLLKSKTTSEQLSEIMQWTQIAVQAAEMIYHESGMGKQKKAYVLRFLEEKGFYIDSESLDAMIEAAVLELRKEME